MARSSHPTGPGTTWVLVASLDHARRGVVAGFIMANHGKRAPLARMKEGDRVVIYSPTTTFPKGQTLRAVTIVGTVSGTAPEPSDVIPGGYRMHADLHEIEPLPLDRIRACFPTNRLRFGCFELPPADAARLWPLIAEQPRVSTGKTLE